MFYREKTFCPFDYIVLLIALHVTKLFLQKQKEIMGSLKTPNQARDRHKDKVGIRTIWKRALMNLFNTLATTAYSGWPKSKVFFNITLWAVGIPRAHSQWWWVSRELNSGPHIILLPKAVPLQFFRSYVLSRVYFVKGHLGKEFLKRVDLWFILLYTRN